jgi:F-box domain
VHASDYEEKRRVEKITYSTRSMTSTIEEENVPAFGNNSISSDDYFSRLPVELITYIALSLHPRDLLNFHLVSRLTYYTTNTDKFKDYIKLYYEAHIANIEGRTQSITLKSSRDGKY